MAKAQAKVCPRSSTRGPKMRKNAFSVILEGQMHVFPMFFDGRPCGFERSLGGLEGAQGRSGATLGAPELALGWLGGVPRERAPHLDAPRGVWEPTLATPWRVHIQTNTHIW